MVHMPFIDGTFAVFGWYVCRLLMVHMTFIDGKNVVYQWYIWRL